MTEPPSTHASGADDAHLDDETLSACLDAELHGQELSEARHHLDTCASCHDRLESLSSATELAGERPEPVPPAIRRSQIARGLEVSNIRHLPESPRARRRPAMAGWAAALLVAIGGGALLWRLHSDYPKTSTTASGTSHKVAGYPAGAQGDAGLSAIPSPPLAFELRVVEGVPFAGCSPPSSTGHVPVNARALYDWSASASSGANRCARLGEVTLRLAGATSASVVPAPRGPLASVNVSVPAPTAQNAKSFLLRHAGSAIAVVVDGEVVGYLSANQALERSVTIDRVPVPFARNLAAELAGR